MQKREEPEHGNASPISVRSFFWRVDVALAGAVVCAIMGCGASLENELGLATAENVPAQALVWKSIDGRGFSVWGSGGLFLFGISGPQDGEVVDVWQWSGGKVVPHRQRYPMSKEGTLALAWLGGQYVAESYKSGDKLVVCRDVTTSNVLKQWPLTKDWYCDQIHTSRNGRYVAIGVSYDSVRGDGDAWKRVGLIGPEMGEITWLPTLGQPPLEFPQLDGDTSLSKVIPSDDGAYVAVAGWRNGAGVYDVRANRLLWYTGHPEGEASLDDIAFSPDNKLVYTGGVMGCIYVMETATGKILDRWWMTKSGRDIYGHRIVTVAASPDGRFVAAGTGPIGLAYVWRASTGERIKVLNHGGSTILILSFSPDSKSLATYAKGQIKVWRMPED